MNITSQATPRRPRSGAFTLIELLTVIAIIGILAAILIPVTGKVRDRARTSQCVSNLRQIALANILYAGENKGVLLTSNQDFVTQATYTSNWQKALSTYMGLDQSTARSRFNCPSAPMTEQQINDGHFTSYNVSRFLGQNPSKAVINRMQKPVVMVADIFVSNVSYTYPWNLSEGVHGQSANRKLLFRHNGDTRRNVGMTDGSARTLSPIQDGVFKEGSAFLPNLWLQVGGGSSATFNPSSPTDTIP